jgi:outer membrane protein assembly factor BamB
MMTPPPPQEKTGAWGALPPKTPKPSSPSFNPTARTLAWAWVASAWAACEAPPPDEQARGGLPPFDAAACALPDPATPSIEPDAWQTGPANNAIRLDGDLAWVVQSASNTVGRLDLRTGAWEPDFVDLGRDGVGRNPWDLAASGGRLYVTNLLTDSISVVDAATGEPLAELKDLGLVAPGSPAVGEDLLLVPGTGFVAPDYGPSQLLALQILDGPPWLQPLARPEPSALNTGAVVFDPHRRRFYAVNTGARRRSAEGWISTSEGTLDAFDLDALRAGDTAPRGSLTLRQGEGGPAGPRDLILTGDQGRLGYLPASNSPHLYKVDLDQWRVLRGGDDPIQAYLGDGDQLTGLAAGEGGLLYLTAFNGDALYLFDATCDASVAGPFDLGTGPLLEGALMPAWDAPRQQLLVLMTLSSRLARAR